MSTTWRFILHGSSNASRRTFCRGLPRSPVKNREHTHRCLRRRNCSWRGQRSSLGQRAEAVHSENGIQETGTGVGRSWMTKILSKIIYHLSSRIKDDKNPLPRAAALCRWVHQTRMLPFLPILRCRKTTSQWAGNEAALRIPTAMLCSTSARISRGCFIPMTGFVARCWRQVNVQTSALIEQGN